MKKRFVPQHYHRANGQRLNKLFQETKGVEDYYKEMGMLIWPAIEEDEETTMARLFDGLNQDIVDKVD